MSAEFIGERLELMQQVVDGYEQLLGYAAPAAYA